MSYDIQMTFKYLLNVHIFSQELLEIKLLLSQGERARKSYLPSELWGRDNFVYFHKIYF